MAWGSAIVTPRRAGWIAVGLGLSMVVLSWSGYRAIQEWQRSAALLAERRAQEAADFLANALTRDMRAVQSSILSTQDWDEYMLEPPYEVRRLVAIAFARYPYPESFFAWRDAGLSESPTFFSRADRRPAWLPSGDSPDRFPVGVSSAPDVGGALIDRIRVDADQQRQYSTFDWHVGGSTYQVVARLKYADPYRLRLSSVLGFVVNLDWVKEHYLQALASEVQRVRGDAVSLRTVVQAPDGLEDRAATGPVVQAQRPFALLFFDPLSLAVSAPADLVRETWAARATVEDDALQVALGGARRALLATALSGTVFAVGLVLMARVIRDGAELGRRRAEFVSSVTHELKTPVSAIRAAGETLVAGRLAGPDVSREYARLVVEQAKRLTRLLNNLLAYARMTETSDLLTAEPQSLADLVHESLRDWRWQFENGGFAVHIDVPPTLPPVRIDRTSFELLLDNLVANAVAYSRDRRSLAITARCDEGMVDVAVADRGIGIPADELAHVTRKFYRGRRSVSGGSGLGLSIAERIAQEHGGGLQIESSDAGTTVHVRLPAQVHA